jgi:hypothetical protein
MMLDATQRHDLALTDKRLFGWHAALFPTGYSGPYEIEVGCLPLRRNEGSFPVQSAKKNCITKR